MGLLAEAGFLDAHEISWYQEGEWRPTRLTHEGHEFSDTVRDAEVWRLTKETAKKAGVASVKALWEIAKSYTKQKLSEHGVHVG